MSRISLDKTPTASELLELIQAGHQVDFDQWSVGQMSGRIWATNPYGRDCCCVDVTAAGCASILRAVTNDTNECEW